MQGLLSLGVAVLMVLPRPEAEVTLACRSAIRLNLPAGARMEIHVPETLLPPLS